MRILYISQYFPPEIGATQTRAHEMAKGLVKAGHQVTMIAEFPNHPHGVIPPEYRGKLFERSTLDGIDVIRVWVSASSTKTFRSRMAFYLSFMVMAVLAGLFLARKKYDLIYSTSPPLFAGGAGLLPSYLRRIPLVFEVRDLWPESAVALGELNNPRFIRWATWLEERCYQRASTIVVTAREILERLVARGIASDKLVLIRNGANVTMFQPDREAGGHIRQELGLDDSAFVVLYAGLHGLAYDLTGLMEAAAQMQHNPNIHFLLVGDGPTKAEVKSYACKLNVTNVTFVDAQPRARIPDFFNAANLSVVPMKRTHIVGTLPIKIYDAMACAIPVIASAEGEICEVIAEANAGITTPPQNVTELCTAILSLQNDPSLCKSLGENGRAAVIKRYTRAEQAHQLSATLEDLVN